jgi:protein TonB
MADTFGVWVSPQPRRSSHRWSTLPVSIGLHGAVLAALAIVPLAVSGALPTPTSVLAFSLSLPSPPPELPPAPRLSAVTGAPTPALTPVEAPDRIVADPDPPPARSAPAPTGDLVVPGGSTVGLTDGGPVRLAAPPPPPVPVRVGLGVQAPVKLLEVPPIYPPIARQAHVTGLVIIEAVIGTDGRVTDARVLRSAPLLDEAALAAVRQWKYRPTLLGGVPVAVVLTVTVNFTLK